MPLHDFCRTNEGVVKVRPPCCAVTQKKIDQLFCSASGVVLSNDLKRKSGMDQVATVQIPFTSAVGPKRMVLYVSWRAPERPPFRVATSLECQNDQRADKTAP